MTTCIEKLRLIWLVLLTGVLFALCTSLCAQAFAQSIVRYQITSPLTRSVMGHGPVAKFRLSQNGRNVKNKAIHLSELKLTASRWSSVDGDGKAPPEVHWFLVKGGVAKEIASSLNRMTYVPVAIDTGSAIRVEVYAKSKGKEPNYTPNPDRSVQYIINTGEIDGSVIDSMNWIDSLKVDKVQALSDGIDKATFTAIVKNDDGSPANNEIVIFTGSGIDAASLTPSDLKAVTNADGVARLTVQSNKNGVEKIVANTAKAPDVKKTASTTFKWYEVSRLTPDSNPTVANGKAINTLMAQVVGLDGKTPAPANIDVLFTKTTNTADLWFEGADSAIQQVVLTTNAKGSAVVRLLSKKAGNYSVSSVTPGKGEVTKSAAAAFIGDFATAKISAIGVDTNNQVADGKSVDRVKVVVIDANDNILPNVKVSFSAGAAVKVGTPIVETDKDGNAIGEFSSTKAGDHEVTASINGVGRLIKIAFVPNAGTATVSSFVAVLNDQVADGVSINKVQAIVHDASGNPVPGATVSFTAPRGVTVKPDSGPTNEDGAVIATFSTTKAGSYTVRASLNNMSKEQSINFVGDAKTAQLVKGSLKIVKNNAVANMRDSDVVQVEITDKNGNALPGFTTWFGGGRGYTEDGKALSAEGVFPVKTDANAIATFRVTAKLAQQWSIFSQPWVGFVLVQGATIGPGGRQRSDWTYLNFVADAKTAKISAVSTTVDKQLANGSAQDEIFVTVTDANNNPVGNADLTFTAPAGVKVETPTVKTDAEGRAVGVFASTKAGAHTITIAVNQNRKTQSINFVADPKTVRIVENSFKIIKNNAIADMQNMNVVQVQLADKNGNPLPNVTAWFGGDRTFDKNDRALTFKGTFPVQTDANGIAVFNIKAKIVKTSEGLRPWVGVTATQNEVIEDYWAYLDFLPNTKTIKISNAASTLMDN